jgi:hypothetical protein
MAGVTDATALLRTAIDQLLSTIDGIRPADMVGIAIRHAGLDKPIYIPMRRYDQVSFVIIGTGYCMLMGYCR